MKILVKFSCDWADEFNCDGFKIFNTLEDWEARRALIANPGFTYNFGSNEGWEYEDHFDENYIACNISDEEAEFLNRMFPTVYTYGFGVFPEYDPDYYDEDEDNDEQ